MIRQAGVLVEAVGGVVDRAGGVYFLLHVPYLAFILLSFAATCASVWYGS